MEPATDALPAEADVARVALRVADLDRLCEFYEAVVGLTVLDHGDDGVTLGSDGEGLLALSERPELPPRGDDETGLFHAAVRVPSRGALADALVRVEDRWELSGASDHRVSEALYLSDPAGNGLEIYRDRPQAEWPIAADGSVEMDTLPLDLSALRELGSATDTVADGTTVGHVHLEVSDLDAARSFYTDGLGMGLRQNFGASAIFLAAGDYHHHVGANVWNGRTEPGDGLGLDWFEVRVPDEAVLSSVRGRFEDRGTELWDVDGGFAVRDPDDIEVRVVIE